MGVRKVGWEIALENVWAGIKAGWEFIKPVVPYIAEAGGAYGVGSLAANAMESPGSDGGGGAGGGGGTRAPSGRPSGGGGYQNQMPVQSSWSFSVEGYYGWGGGTVFGKNPDGKLFVSFRVGYGLGGGLSYNPNGTSPGWDSRYKVPPGMNLSLGVFGQASVGFLPAYAGLSGEAGILAGQVGPYHSIMDGFAGYSDIKPEYGLDYGWHLRLGGAVGGEIGFFSY